MAAATKPFLVWVDARASATSHHASRVRKRPIQRCDADEAESRAMLALAPEGGRVNWTDVARQLAARGFPARTARVVRRHVELLRANLLPLVPSPTPTPAEREAAASSEASEEEEATGNDDDDAALLSALARFHAREGHCLVPSDHVEPAAPGAPAAAGAYPLGASCDALREAPTRARLGLAGAPSALRRQLNALGFVWDLEKHEHARVLKALVVFRERHGHVSVPASYTTTDPLGLPLALGERVRQLRGSHYQSALGTRTRPTAFRKHLSALGFVWNLYTTYDGFGTYARLLHELERFVQVTGHTPAWLAVNAYRPPHDPAYALHDELRRASAADADGSAPFSDEHRARLRALGAQPPPAPTVAAAVAPGEPVPPPARPSRPRPPPKKRVAYTPEEDAALLQLAPLVGTPTGEMRRRNWRGCGKYSGAQLVARLPAKQRRLKIRHTWRSVCLALARDGFPKRTVSMASGRFRVLMGTGHDDDDHDGGDHSEP